ncbi:DUF4158 domain-containing protein [Salmonella enterica]|nr:DUF4158 domain-containing protein [Salmonella enterica]
MPRRQILSSEEKERLLVVPDDDVLLTRMCFLSEHDLALINKHRRPANRLGFAVLGVSLDIENYCTLRWFFVPLSCGGALAALSEKRTSARSKKMPAFSCLYF